MTEKREIERLPLNLIEWLNESRKIGMVFGISYKPEVSISDIEFNKHLDRTALLFMIHQKKETGEIILGTMDDELDKRLFFEEIDYLLRVLETLKEDLGKSHFKFFKRKEFEKLKETLIKLIESFINLKKASKKEMLGFLKQYKIANEILLPSMDLK